MATITTIQKHYTTLFLKELRDKANGKVFSVEFFKKDGTLRKMNARFDVKSGITGRGLDYDPLDHGLINVFDMQKRGYRMIIVNNISKLKVAGKTYNFGA